MIETENRPHVKQGPVKYTKGFTRKRFFSKIFTTAIFLMIFSIVALAIFVYVKQPVKTEDGYIMADPIYEIIEHGQKVIIVNDEGYNMFTPLKRAIFTQEAFPARIVAGPYGKIDQLKGKYRVTDGVNVVSVNLKDPKEFLDMEYVARKIDKNGDFIETELDIVVNKERVLGGIIEETK